MNYAEIAADVLVPEVRPLELFILLLCQVGHGTLELCDDTTRREIARCKDTQFGLASMVGITRRVCDFYTA